MDLRRHGVAAVMASAALALALAQPAAVAVALMAACMAPAVAGPDTPSAGEGGADLGQGAAGGDAASGGDGGAEAVEAPVCAPGESGDCGCPDGSRGSLSCAEDGSGWGPCECPPCVEDECDSSEQCVPGTICAREGPDDAGCRRCLPAPPWEPRAEDPCEGRRDDPEASCGECGGDCSSVTVRIEPGTFLMGSPEDEPCRGHDETLHEVVISRPFLIWATEVTQAQYAAVTRHNPSRDADCGPDCPVESVSWVGAARFCNALSRVEGLEECYELGTEDRIIPPFHLGNADEPRNVGPAVVWPRGLDCRGWRLPTEAEWEYTARAGTRTAYHTGAKRTLGGCDHQPDPCPTPDRALDRAGWYVCNSGGRLHPAAGKRPNAWGLFDVHGNVAEWVWDWDRAPLPLDRSVDPTGAAGNSEGFNVRVVRGGGLAGRRPFLPVGLPRRRLAHVPLAPVRVPSCSVAC